MAIFFIFVVKLEIPEKVGKFKKNILISSRQVELQR